MVKIAELPSTAAPAAADLVVLSQGGVMKNVPVAALLAVPSSAYLLAGPGIDPTGATDSRAAVQAIIDAAPAGSTIVNPSGSVLRLNSGITINKQNIRLTGSGEWRFRTGGTYGPDPSGQNGFIDVRGDYGWLDGLYVTNPDGVLNRGLCFISNYGKATNNTLIGFGAGIHVSPAGEFHHHTISGNHIYDVIGSGGGSSDTTSVGEDYGDGIMCWGAAVTITGNVVTCKAGRDARIGIHVEGLDDQAKTPWVHDHAMAVIQGNVVTGQFRRGIAAEGVHHVSITGNTVADATWWAIASISSNHTVIQGNTIRYTRTASDVQGNYWNPSRSAIMIYAYDGTHPVVNNVVANNTVLVTAGATCFAGIQIQTNDTSTAAAIGTRLTGNRILGTGALTHGIYAAISTDLEVDANHVKGVTGNGVYLYQHNGSKVRQNSLIGPANSGASTAVWFEGGSKNVVEGNTMLTWGTGVYIVNQTVRSTVSSNNFDSIGTGVNGYGCATPFMHSLNVFTSVATLRTNMPTTISVGNSA